MNSLIMCTAVALSIVSRARAVQSSGLSLLTRQFKSKTSLCSVITSLSANPDQMAPVRGAGSQYGGLGTCYAMTQSATAM